MTMPAEPNKVGRRGFIVGLVAFLAAGAGYLRWGNAAQESEPLPEGSQRASDPARSHAASHAKEDTRTHEAFFAPADHPTLFALADVIVPRDGAFPAASEIDLLPRLEAWIQSDSARRFIYSAFWPELVRASQSPRREEEGHRGNAGEAKLLAQDPLEAACESWYAEYRSRGSRASSAAQIFEQLRRDVLRVYYSTDVGHSVLGYTGPAMRRHSPIGPA